MSSPPQQLRLNTSPDVYEMIRARMAELRYRGESDYLLALALHDCLFRKPQPHVMGLRTLNQRKDLRRAELERIVRDFYDGVRPSEELPVEQAMVQLLVERLSNLPARVRSIKSGAKPSQRRR